MNLQDVRQNILVPAFQILPMKLHSQEAEVLMLAIGLQESRFTHREQIGGPARGFWQFERGGGVRGVVLHPSTDQWIGMVCTECDVFPHTVQNIYDSLSTNDVLAACFARMFLYTNPKPIPALFEGEAAWDYYIATWRPGKPHRHTWDAFYADAVAAVQESVLVL